MPRRPTVRLLAVPAAVALAALALAGCSRKADEGGEAAAPAAGSATSATAAAAIPRPTPGKWRMTTEMADLPAGMPSLPAVEICITPEMVADNSWAAGPNGKPETCSTFDVSASGGVVKTHAVCSAAGVTSTIDSTMQGDFTRRYVSEAVVSHSPAAPGAPNPMRMKATMERVGDC